jgi:hypothetical protein
MVLPLAVVLLLAPAAGLRLEWLAPAACPDGAAVRARVVDLVGAEAAGQAMLTARAAVRSQAGGWTMTLVLVHEGGEDRRTLADRDCGALAEAAALVIAVAIDPQAVAGGPVLEDSFSTDGDAPQDGSLVPLPPGGPEPGAGTPSRTSGTVAGPGDSSRDDVPKDTPDDRAVLEDSAQDEPGPKDSTQDRAAARRAATTRSARKLRVGLRLGAGLGFTALLPGPHAALDLGLGLEGRLWRVELAALFVPPVRGVAASDPGIGGVFRLGAGELRGCAMPGPRTVPLVFPLCVGLQIGAMHGSGEGSGLQEKQTARALWVATRIGPALRWRPRDGRVGLWLGLDAIVALTRPEFVTAGGARVHEAAPVGGQASVGLEIRLR